MAAATQPTNHVYTHTTRPPHASNGQHANQLRYGGFVCTEVSRYKGPVTEFEVYRDSECMHKTAQLTIETHYADSGFRCEQQISLNADQLESLAFALLDAAAHLRSLKGGAA